MVAPASLCGRRELRRLPVVPLDGHTELSLAELGVVRHQTDRTYPAALCSCDHGCTGQGLPPDTTPRAYSLSVFVSQEVAWLSE